MRRTIFTHVGVDDIHESNIVKTGMVVVKYTAYKSVDYIREALMNVTQEPPSTFTGSNV